MAKRNRKSHSDQAEMVKALDSKGYLGLVREALKDEMRQGVMELFEQEKEEKRGPRWSRKGKGKKLQRRK